jgi:hypothetical protein
MGSLGVQENEWQWNSVIMKLLNGNTCDGIENGVFGDSDKNSRFLWRQLVE